MKRGILWLLVLLLLFFMIWGLSWSRTQEPVKVKKSVDQHWIVKDDVAPTDLQRQLEILNKAGTRVDLATNLFVVGNHFVIVVNDGTSEDEDSGGER